MRPDELNSNVWSLNVLFGVCAQVKIDVTIEVMVGRSVRNEAEAAHLLP